VQERSQPFDDGFQAEKRMIRDKIGEEIAKWRSQAAGMLDVWRRSEVLQEQAKRNRERCLEGVKIHALTGEFETLQRKKSHHQAWGCAEQREAQIARAGQH
jgi:hypothetical protein